MRAHRSVLCHNIGRTVVVTNSRDVELVDIVDGDGEGAGLEAAVGAGGRDRNRAAAPSASRSIARGYGDHAGVRVDRKPAAVVVVQRVGDRIAAVRII